MKSRWGRVGVGCGLALVMAYATMVIVFRVVLPVYKNTTAAMDPTVGMGDMVITNKSVAVRRGDVIVHNYPLKPTVIFIKRIIAVPGDTVVIRDKRVFLNGQELREPY